MLLFCKHIYLLIFHNDLYKPIYDWLTSSLFTTPIEFLLLFIIIIMYMISSGVNNHYYVILGWYMEPAVFTNVQDGTFIAKEESFGPIMVISKFDNG